MASQPTGRDVAKTLGDHLRDQLQTFEGKILALNLPIAINNIFKAKLLPLERRGQVPRRYGQNQKNVND